MSKQRWHRAKLNRSDFLQSVCHSYTCCIQVTNFVSTQMRGHQMPCWKNMLVRGESITIVCLGIFSLLARTTNLKTRGSVLWKYTIIIFIRIYFHVMYI